VPRRHLLFRVGLSLGLISTIIMWLCRCFPNATFAHEVERVHPSLTFNSFRALSASLDSFYTPANQDQVREGSIDEDSGLLRFRHHFYNPITEEGLNLPTANTARNRAGDLWAQAVAKHVTGMTTGNDNAFHLLGRVLHLLQDMTSPSHVHNDAHGGLDLDLDSDVDDFEDWGAINPPLVVVSLPEPRFPKSRISVDGEDGFVDELAKIVYEFTTFRGELATRFPLEDVRQPDSELRRMFPSLTYNPFTFNWNIDDIGNTSGKCGGEVEDEWWPMVPEGSPECEKFRDASGGTGTRGRFYIENSGGDSGSLRPGVYEKALLYTNVDNHKTLLQIYGDTLYPLAVAYGAGLLQLFQEQVTGPNTPPDGRLDAPANNATVSGPVTVSGWAIDKETPASSLTLTLLIDGAVVPATFTRHARPDICGFFPETSFPGSCQSGFHTVWTPAAGLTGPHTVAVRVTDGGGQSLTLGPVTVTVSGGGTPPPPGTPPRRPARRPHGERDRDRSRSHRRRGLGDRPGDPE